MNETTHSISREVSGDGQKDFGKVDAQLGLLSGTQTENGPWKSVMFLAIETSIHSGFSSHV